MSYKSSTREQSFIRPLIATTFQALLEHLIGRAAERTIQFYRNRLTPFVEMHNHKRIDQITVSDIERFIATLVRRKRRYEKHPLRQPQEGSLSASYIQGFERAIRRLLYFAVERNWLHADENPWPHYKPIRALRKFPKCARESDYPTLIAATSGEGTAQIRNRAILSLFIDTGCRRGGIANLCLDGVDLKVRKILTIEKSGPARYYLTARAAKALQDWLNIRPTTKHDYVFTSLRKDNHGAYPRLRARGVEAVLRHLKERTGIEGPANCHAFRHSYVRGMLRRKVGLKAAGQLVNHKQVTTTADRYGDFEEEELKDIHDAFSPLNDVPDEAWGSDNDDDNDTETQ